MDEYMDGEEGEEDDEDDDDGEVGDRKAREGAGWLIKLDPLHYSTMTTRKW